MTEFNASDCFVSRTATGCRHANGFPAIGRRATDYRASRYHANRGRAIACSASRCRLNAIANRCLAN